MEIVNPMAQAMFEAASRFRKESGVRSYLGMSIAGDPCPRKIWYQFRGYTPTALDGRAQMIFSLGSAVEAEVLKWLKGAGYKISGQQEEFSLLKGYVKGHCDGIIDGVKGARPHILEIKSASASRFKAFKLSGIPAISPTYAAQIQLYMGCSGLERGVWVVMCKDNCDIYIERARFDRKAFLDLQSRAEGIINANEAPERAFTDDSRECQTCPYNGHCWHAPYVQETPTCGSCAFCRIENLTPHCMQFDNHEITKWGASCPRYAFRDSGDIVPF